jgi:hypothetical protein
MTNPMSTTGEIFSEEQKLSYISDNIYKFQPAHVQRTMNWIQIPTDKSIKDMMDFTKIVQQLDGKLYVAPDGQVVWIYLKKKKIPSLLRQGLAWCSSAILVGAVYYETHEQLFNYLIEKAIKMFF